MTCNVILDAVRKRVEKIPGVTVVHYRHGENCSTVHADAENLYALVKFAEKVNAKIRPYTYGSGLRYHFSITDEGFRRIQEEFQ